MNTHELAVRMADTIFALRSKQRQNIEIHVSRPELVTMLETCASVALGLQRETDTTTESKAVAAAQQHLARIGWTPEKGTTDRALGLDSKEWAYCPDGFLPQLWDVMCRNAVRKLAALRTEERAP